MTDGARWPVGKGMFVWRIARCAGGVAEMLAAMARAAGLGWVALKVADGTLIYNGDLQAHVQALKAGGVQPWGWSYIYGGNPVVEAGRVIERVRRYGLAGWLVNAEHQFKEPGMGRAATLFMEALRDGLPDLPIGLCSYRYPSFHPQFPWREFLALSDFHAPQVYWLEDNRPTAPAQQLARSVSELRAIRDIPIVPIGVASPNDAGTWRPTVSQLDNFHAAVRVAGLPGVGWWEWGHAELRHDVWRAIAGHWWEVAPAPPPPDTSAARIEALARLIIAEVS